MARLVERALRGDDDVPHHRRRPGLCGEVPSLLQDEREILSDTVVDVAGDPLSLVEHGRSGQQALRAPQFQGTPDEEGEEEPEPQHVADVEVRRVQRGKKEVVQPRKRAQDRRDREPA